ncbi:DUF5681 domain-containing protein [Endozoicomonas acroporae]|uniref:DUF5681 domain-containing protein n=1 Tax=Endozoicomonas acroporae TaxID=1701104 RepID=UPI0013D0A97E|nr:DUF5681 domain-containing protein [Endozoicomonas acroporae]
MAYKKGETGNPNGRPKGSGNKDIGALRKVTTTEDSQAVIQQIVSAAKAGDPAMTKLYMTKLCPPLTPKDRLIEIPGLTKKKSLTGKAKSVLDAVATGQITPAEAGNLMNGIAALSKMIDAEELINKLTELEGRTSELESKR